MDSNPTINSNWLSEIEKLGVRKTFPADSVLLSPGDTVHYLPFVISGSIRITKEDDDYKEILLYYIGPGESCIMSFLGELHHTPSQIKAVTEEESVILLIPSTETARLVQANPKWMEFLLDLFHKRFDDLLSVINAIAFQRVDQRLEEWLVKKSELMGDSLLTTTHQQIAEELGTAREVVSRLLKQLERQGKIELGRNKIRLISLV
jgi:CRP/FNR family transcriptional regulator, anaerobic regulatory protein